MTTLQEKIDVILEDYGLLFDRGLNDRLNQVLQEFREQIESLPTHRYKVGNDYFVGISFHRIMELIGEKK